MICTLPRDTLQLASHFCIAVLLSYPFALLSPFFPFSLPANQPSFVSFHNSFRTCPSLCSSLNPHQLQSHGHPRPVTASLAFLVVLADPGGDLPPSFRKKHVFSRSMVPVIFTSIPFFTCNITFNRWQSWPGIHRWRLWRVCYNNSLDPRSSDTPAIAR